MLWICYILLSIFPVENYLDYFFFFSIISRECRYCLIQVSVCFINNSIKLIYLQLWNCLLLIENNDITLSSGIRTGIPTFITTILCNIGNLIGLTIKLDVFLKTTLEIVEDFIASPNEEIHVTQLLYTCVFIL